MSTVFQSVAALLGSRQKKRTETFESLVAQLAEGKEPSAAVIADMLEGSGRTVADLEAAVAEKRHRLELQQRVRDAEQAAGTAAGIRAKISKADAKLQAARAEHEATTAPLQVELERIRQSTLAGESARRELADSCTDSAALSVEAEAQEQQRQLSRRAADLAGRLDTLSATAAGLRQSLKQSNKTPQQQSAEMAPHDARLTELREELAEVQQQQAEAAEAANNAFLARASA